MADIKFLDVVKWLNPMGDFEKQDIMAVEDVDGDFLTVRHLSDGKAGGVSKIYAHNVKVVGHCSPTEPVTNIIYRYINS